MNSYFAFNALVAQLVSQTAAPEAAPSPFSGIWMMAIIVMIFWFLVISPQRKEMKEKDKMRENVKKGDNIVTAGGAHGQVVAVEKDSITVRIAEKVHVVFERSAISRVLPTAANASGEAKK